MRLALAAVLLSGCYIVAPDDDSTIGGDDDSPPPIDGGQGPVGRSFFIQRQRTSPSSCGDFAEQDQPHQISVTASDVRVDGMLAGNANVSSQGAVEANFDSPNVRFTVLETWTSLEGGVSPEVDYQLWISGNTVTGDVNATFQFIDTICSYTWRVQ